MGLPRAVNPLIALGFSIAAPCVGPKSTGEPQSLICFRPMEGLFSLSFPRVYAIICHAPQALARRHPLRRPKQHTNGLPNVSLSQYFHRIPFPPSPMPRKKFSSLNPCRQRGIGMVHPRQPGHFVSGHCPDDFVSPDHLRISGRRGAISWLVESWRDAGADRCRGAHDRLCPHGGCECGGRSRGNYLGHSGTVCASGGPGLISIVFIVVVISGAPGNPGNSSRSRRISRSVPWGLWW